MEELIKRQAIERKLQKNQENMNNEKNGFLKMYLKYILNKFITNFLNLFRKKKDQLYNTPITFDAEHNSDEEKINNTKTQNETVTNLPYQKINPLNNNSSHELMKRIIETPIEIQEHIFSFLKEENLKNLSQTSKYFREISKDPLNKCFNYYYINRNVWFKDIYGKTRGVKTENVNPNTTYGDLAERALTSEEKKTQKAIVMSCGKDHTSTKIGTLGTNKLATTHLILRKK